MPPSPAQSSRGDDRRQFAQLEARIDSLQRELAAVESKVSLQQSRLAKRPAKATHDRRPEDQDMAPNEVQATRAADAERHRIYMTEVAQAFSNEKIDSSWAAHATSRIDTALYNDAALRGITHNVECRAQTCRVSIEDDGSGELSSRLPMLLVGLTDVVPIVSAERVDQGNGSSAMILYMSSRREPPFRHIK